MRMHAVLRHGKAAVCYGAQNSTGPMPPTPLECSVPASSTMPTCRAGREAGGQESTARGGVRVQVAVQVRVGAARMARGILGPSAPAHTWLKVRMREWWPSAHARVVAAPPRRAGQLT